MSNPCDAGLVWTQFQKHRQSLDDSFRNYTISDNDETDLKNKIKLFKDFMNECASLLPPNLLKQVQEYYRNALERFHAEKQKNEGFTFKYSNKCKSSSIMNVLENKFNEHDNETSIICSQKSQYLPSLLATQPKYTQTSLVFDNPLQYCEYCNNNMSFERNSLKLKNRSNEIIHIRSMDPLDNANISHLISVRIVFNTSIKRSIIIKDAVNSIFILECQQLRLKDCINCHFYITLKTASMHGAIVLESCSGCYFGQKIPIIHYQPGNLLNSDICEILTMLLNNNNKNNQFDLSIINDFDWIDVSTKSPNVLSIETLSQFLVAIFILENNTVKFLEMTV